MCGNHLGLARALLRDGDFGIESPADLARLQEEDWFAAIELAQVSPPTDAVEPITDWRRRLARGLQRAVQLEYPTAAVEPIVERSHSQLGFHRETGRWLADVRRAAAEGRLPAFDLRAVHVDRYVTENAGRIAFQLEDETALRSDLKRLQRTLLIAEEPIRIEPLLRQGHDSAFKVAHLSATEFGDVHAEAMGREAASAIHARARQIHSAHLFVHLTVGDAIATSRTTETENAP
jgi:hypothetical protein